MKVYLVGNSLVKKDSLPVKLSSTLKKKFPKLKFQEVDPTENFVPEDGSIIIDTVQGINKVTLFATLDEFVDSPRISPHDYDLLFHLKLLRKLKRIKEIRIIGIPNKLTNQTEIQVINLLTGIVVQVQS